MYFPSVVVTSYLNTWYGSFLQYFLSLASSPVSVKLLVLVKVFRSCSKSMYPTSGHDWGGVLQAAADGDADTELGMVNRGMRLKMENIDSGQWSWWGHQWRLEQLTVKAMYLPCPVAEAGRIEGNVMFSRTTGRSNTQTNELMSNEWRITL